MCCGYGDCKTCYLGGGRYSTGCCCKRCAGCCCKCCAVCWKWQARLIWFSVFIISLLGMFLFLYFLGYDARKKYNENSIKTNCTIVNQVVRPTTYHSYSDKCKCQKTCVGGTCTEECKTCDYAYHEGVITVKYLEILTSDFIVVEWNTKYKDANLIWAKLREDYPMNSIIPCYYQKDKTSEVTLALYPLIGWLASSLFFVAVIGIVIVIWAILDGWRGCCKLLGCCEGMIHRKNIIKKQKLQQKQREEAEKQKMEEKVRSEEKSAVSEVTEVTIQ